MEMKRKKISVTSLILPVIMLVVAVILPMIYSTNYYIQLFSQTLINLVAVLGLNVVMGLAGQTNLGTIALVALGSYTSALISQATGSTSLHSVCWPLWSSPFLSASCSATRASASAASSCP